VFVRIRRSIIHILSRASTGTLIPLPALHPPSMADPIDLDPSDAELLLHILPRNFVYSIAYISRPDCRRRVLTPCTIRVLTGTGSTVQAGGLVGAEDCEGNL